MRRFRRFVAMALVALFCCAAAPDRAEAACALRVGWTQYPVYTFKDAQGNVTGIDAELTNAIAKDIGCTVKLVELPWARIVSEIRNGTLDMTSSASRTPEREAFARFSDPYREAEVAIFVRRGEFKQVPAGWFVIDLPNGFQARDRGCLLLRGRVPAFDE